MIYIDKLEAFYRRFKEIEQSLADPAVTGNQKKYQSMMKEYSDLKEAVGLYHDLKGAIAHEKEYTEIIAHSLDQELISMAEAELLHTKEKLAEIEKKVRLFLVPKEPNDFKNVIMEIRAGTGGEEAALFAGVLFRMYTRYVERKGWRIEIMDSTSTGLGGFKDVVISIQGKDVFQTLKYERGGHRVQRIPVTESGGRIHTSAATVAVLPEVDEVDFKIDPKDIRIDVYRASGAGGQHVNKTESAVRITHLPTNLIVQCQDGKSQHQNKAQAFKVLRARLQEHYEEERRSKIAHERKTQIGSGDRNERIRTYNFPQGRLTDHRINLSLYNLAEILEGSLDELLDTLRERAYAENITESLSE